MDIATRRPRDLQFGTTQQVGILKLGQIKYNLIYPRHLFNLKFEQYASGCR